MDISNTFVQYVYQLNYPALVGQLLSPTLQPEERDIILRRLLEINQTLLQQRGRRRTTNSGDRINMGEIADDIFDDSSDGLNTNFIPSGISDLSRVNSANDGAREKVTSAIDRIKELSKKIGSRR